MRLDGQNLVSSKIVRFLENPLFQAMRASCHHDADVRSCQPTQPTLGKHLELNASPDAPQESQRKGQPCTVQSREHEDGLLNLWSDGMQVLHVRYATLALGLSGQCMAGSAVQRTRTIYHFWNDSKLSILAEF